MFLIDHQATTPSIEMKHAFNRIPSKYATKSPLRGRVVCIFKVFFHSAGIILKPTFYAFCGISELTELLISKIFKLPTETNGKPLNYLILCIVAPVGQTLQVGKAGLGILHPQFYFKEESAEANLPEIPNPLTANVLDPLFPIIEPEAQVNNLGINASSEKEEEISPNDPYFIEKGWNKYFVRLANVAKSVDCEPKLCEMLKYGTEIRISTKKKGNALAAYDVLFKQDLEIICNKLESAELESIEKKAILEMFADHDDTKTSGLYGCSPIFGRLLEQICDCLNAPQDPKQIIPWLISQHKMEIINIMAMKEELLDKFYSQCAKWSRYKYEAHLGNLFVAHIGHQVGLQLQTINRAMNDFWYPKIPFSDNDKNNLLIMFMEKYNEKDVLAYIQQKINSQPDGKPGLKSFRNYIIQKLIENVTDTELESSKEKIKKELNIKDIFADDPSFYVQLHYYLNPHMNPSEEASIDLNEAGIKKFIEIEKLSL